ncbi:MAG: glycosyltransferase family 39 protein, partial [Planctomycetes bacterium]|nr:glycosyltransferase family 39 protein [Planctomycetota bacterium]
GIDLGDEGALAYGAERVLQGQIPHRDFYCNHPPLSSYTAAAMFKLFGTSIASLRILGICIYLLITLSVYLLLRQLTGHLAALVVAVPTAIFGMPSYHFIPFASVHGIFAILVAMLLFIRAVFTGRRWWAFATGSVTVLVMVARQDYGFYLLVAILVYAFALKFTNPQGQGKINLSRLLGFWLAGIAALSLPLMIYWFAVGAIPSMVQQLIIFPFTRYAETSSIPMPIFRSYQTLSQNLIVAMFYLPPVIGVLAAGWLVAAFVRRRFYFRQACLVFILVPSVLSYYQVLVRSDIFHVLDTLPLFLVLFGWWLSTLSKSAENGNKRMSLSATVGTLLLVVVVGMWYLSHTKHTFLGTSGRPLRKVALERAGINLSPEYASVLEDIVKRIQMYAEPNRPIISLPYHSMFYFLSQRHNPTQWDYFWPGDQTPEEFQTFIRQCHLDPPAVILIIRREEMSPSEKVVLDYVDSEYRLVHEGSGMTLYLPLKQPETKVK